MRPAEQFDEVMIVNPYDPTSGQGEMFMRFYRRAPSGFGYYAAPAPASYAAPPASYGYYAATPAYAEAPDYGYAEPPEYGYYAEAPEYGAYPRGYGYAPYAEAPEYAEAPDYGYYREAPEYAGYGEPPEYAEAPEYGYYAEPPEYSGCAEPPEYAGYGEPPEYAEAPEYGYYGEAPEMVGYNGYGVDPTLEGYVRARSPNFNAGCMLPTNVAGVEEAPEFAGYVAPSSVNATVTGFTGQPGNPNPPDAFRPLF